MTVKLNKGLRSGSGVLSLGNVIKSLTLEPPPRPLPEYVPAGIRNDYAEACAIVDLSPKSAAALARRALQGMIRDYWEIHDERTLKDEIDAIKDNVDAETWNAIDAVRKVGNVGAHMEQDVNMIVSVEPAEADRLLWLVRELIRDWYIRRHERKLRFDELARLALEKERMKTK